MDNTNINNGLITYEKLFLLFKENGNKLEIGKKICETVNLEPYEKYRDYIYIIFYNKLELEKKYIEKRCKFVTSSINKNKKTKKYYNDNKNKVFKEFYDYFQENKDMFVIPQQLNTLQKRPRIRIDNEQTNNIVIVDSTDSQVVAPQKRANVTDTLFRSDIVFSYDNLPSNISQRRIENSQKLTNRNLNTMICNDLIINRKIENTIVRNELIFDIIKDKIQKNINYEEVGERIFNIIGLEPTINDYDKVCKTFDKKIFKISKNVTINEIILNQNKKINYILDFFIFDNNDNKEQQQVDQQNIDNNYIFNANIV